MNYAMISVRNLRLRTFIGFNPEERRKKQDIVINLEIDHQLNPGVLDDDIDCALNYKNITKSVIDLVEKGKFLLLEKLVADVVGICSQHSCIRRCRVTVDKPNALRFADSVSLTLEHVKHEQDFRSGYPESQTTNPLGVAP